MDYVRFIGRYCFYMGRWCVGYCCAYLCKACAAVGWVLDKSCNGCVYAARFFSEQAWRLTSLPDLRGGRHDR